MLRMNFLARCPAHSCNPSTQRQEDQEFKATFSYVLSSRLVWNTLVLCLKNK